MFRNISNQANLKRAVLTLYPKCTTTSTVYRVHTSSVLKKRFEIDNEEQFRTKVMENPLPVIVNFHAEWCEPCHNLRPILDKICQENEGKIHLAEIMVEDNMSLLEAFEVTAVPAVIAIHNGQVTDKFIGLVDAKQIKTFVDKLLSDGS